VVNFGLLNIPIYSEGYALFYNQCDEVSHELILNATKYQSNVLESFYA